MLIIQLGLNQIVLMIYRLSHNIQSLRQFVVIVHFLRLFQSTEEQINLASHISTEEHGCTTTGPRQILTSAMTHQEKSNEKSVEVDDSEKPEDITKPENEKADSSVVLRETTSTSSEV